MMHANATETKPADLLARFESDDLSPCGCDGSTLRAQLAGHELRATIADDGPRTSVSDDGDTLRFRVRESKSPDGLWLISASISWLVEYLKQGNQRNWIHGSYSCEVSDGLAGPGPWVLRIQPDGRPKCACCKMPERLALSRAG